MLTFGAAQAVPKRYVAREDRSVHGWGSDQARPVRGSSGMRSTSDSAARTNPAAVTVVNDGVVPDPVQAPVDFRFVRMRGSVIDDEVATARLQSLE